MTAPIEYDRVVALSPAVRRITQRNPGNFTGPGTNTHLVGESAIVILDPGEDLGDGHLERIVAAVAGAPVRAVIPSHGHPDHWPLAPRLSAALGAPIWFYGTHPGFRTDRSLADGDRLDAGGIELETVYTPGHCRDHLSFVLAAERAGFPGDVVMGWSSSIIAPPEGSLPEYLRSLDRLLAVPDLEVLYPAHGEAIARPYDRIRELAAHRHERTRQVLEALGEGPSRIGPLVGRIYVGVAPALHPAAAQSLSAHLLALESEGAIGRSGPGEDPVWWISPPLTGLVTAEFAGRAGGLGLTADAVRTDYVLNWGGFVNQSFRIGDGRRAYHLKLSADPEGQAALAAWYRIHDVLTANYQAPPVIDWITIGGTDHQGLLFPHVDGAAPARWDREWRHAIGTVILRLHADHTLRRRAFGDVSPPSCESGYRDDFHARFVADLAEVRAHRPAFVSDDDVRWMEAEVADLVAQVGASEAFQEPADALIHGDLWPNNILALPNGSWYLLDWDDHRLGDPALDLAKLLNPGPGPADAPDDTEINALVGFDSQVRERFELYARAARLDWIIDPLADWIEAAGAPDHTNAVRIEKERQYREARARYR